tara:strand:+ start:8111 stop:8821 length:711 start_codon:yes stop_codon:yes gene_type:complete
MFFELKIIHPKIFLGFIITFVFVPFVNGQNLDPNRFEETIRAFEREDALNNPPENAIVLTGSSSIARWNDNAEIALAPLTVIPRGFGGSVMGDVLHYLDRVALVYKPRAILIYEGDNDTAYKLSEDLIVEQFEQIVAKVAQELPGTRIYVLAVKPSVSRLNVWDAAQSVSERFSAIAKSNPMVNYIDAATPFLDSNGNVMDDIFVEDNLHLNQMGNQIWGALIKAGLMPTEIRFEY